MLECRVLGELHALFFVDHIGHPVEDRHRRPRFVLGIEQQDRAQVGLQRLRDASYCCPQDGVQLERPGHLELGVEQIHQASDLGQRLLVDGLQVDRLCIKARDDAAEGDYGEKRKGQQICQANPARQVGDLVCHRDGGLQQVSARQHCQ